jgi:hypothetical protein
MRKEVPSKCAMPMHQARRYLGEVTGSQYAGRRAAELNHASALGGDEHLTGLVGVPVGACTWVKLTSVALVRDDPSGVANASCSTVPVNQLAGVAFVARLAAGRTVTSSMVRLHPEAVCV